MRNFKTWSMPSNKSQATAKAGEKPNAWLHLYVASMEVVSAVQLSAETGENHVRSFPYGSC